MKRLAERQPRDCADRRISNFAGRSPSFPLEHDSSVGDRGVKLECPAVLDVHKGLRRTVYDSED